MRSLPGSAVKLSSPGVPIRWVLRWIVTWSVSVSGPPVPVLPSSLVVIVSVSLPKKSCAPW